jgi:hypothetical protein
MLELDSYTGLLCYVETWDLEEQTPLLSALLENTNKNSNVPLTLFILFTA